MDLQTIGNDVHQLGQVLFRNELMLRRRRWNLLVMRSGRLQHKRMFLTLRLPSCIHIVMSNKSNKSNMQICSTSMQINWSFDFNQTVLICFVFFEGTLGVFASFSDTQLFALIPVRWQVAVWTCQKENWRRLSCPLKDMASPTNCIFFLGHVWKRCLGVVSISMLQNFTRIFV